MKKIIINAFGKDKPGLVSKITKIIQSYNGNIEVSKMIQLESDFTLLMLIKIKNEEIEDLFKTLNNLNDLVITGRETKEKEYSNNYLQYSFSIVVSDNEGIIYIFSNLFKKHNINIINMDTFVKNAPITGSPIFVLESILMLPNKIKLESFKKDLNELAEKNGVEYQFNLKNN